MATLTAQDALELAPPPQPTASQSDFFAEQNATDLPEGADVLVTGPLHEAYAEQFTDQPEAGLVVKKEPPAPIDELPPEYRPDGSEIEWIPGYWGWDIDRDDFIWITGIWRQTPPDHNWIPGYWTQVPEGFQWISGFWSLNNTTEIAYLPAPPEPLEALASTPAPSDNHFWIPGQWNYNDNDYQWRAGYWTEGYTDWVWVADRYVWTPNGYIYRAGYWDYLVQERGTIFCPIYWSRPVPNYQFRPSYVVNSGPNFLANLFVYPRYNHYYYGNYYGSRNLGQSLYPWVSFTQQSRRYDPLYGYYHTQHRDLDYVNRVTRLHNHYAANPNIQPSLTLAAQRQAIARGGNDQDLAFQAQRISSLINDRSSALSLVRLADAERQQVQSGLVPARELRQQRAEIEGKQSDRALANNPNGNVRDRDNKIQPGGTPGDRPGKGQDRKWNLPKDAAGNRLGSVAVANDPQASKTSGDEALNKNDRTRGGDDAAGGQTNAARGKATDQQARREADAQRDKNRNGRPETRDPLGANDGKSPVVEPDKNKPARNDVGKTNPADSTKPGPADALKTNPADATKTRPGDRNANKPNPNTDKPTGNDPNRTEPVVPRGNDARPDRTPGNNPGRADRDPKQPNPNGSNGNSAKGQPGAPANPPRNIAPGEPNPNTPRPGTGANSNPSIQDDIKQMRDMSQRQTQQRREAGATRRVAPQPPAGGAPRAEQPKANPPAAQPRANPPAAAQPKASPPAAAQPRANPPAAQPKANPPAAAQPNGKKADGPGPGNRGGQKGRDKDK